VAILSALACAVILETSGRGFDAAVFEKAGHFDAHEGIHHDAHQDD